MGSHAQMITKTKLKTQSQEIQITNKLNQYFFQELKKQRDQLHKYQKRIELSLEKDRTLAKKLLSEGKKE